jgi:glyceraldehyde 3-phosphate dehydrogenase
MKIGINGFGRVGKQIFKALVERYPEIQVKQINDIASASNLAHLLKYDSNYGIYPKEVKSTPTSLIVDQETIQVTNVSEIGSIPWDSSIDLVIEATGVFTGRKEAGSHLSDHVKHVIITAPSKDADVMVVLGVNESVLDPVKHQVISNASCTTNSLAPVVKVLHEHFHLERGFMTTVHSYTSDQRILDLPHKDPRRARAGAINIIPTTTGAANAVGRVIPDLNGKLTGISLRVPTPTVSITDFVCTVTKPTSIEEVNHVLEQASQTTMKGILGFTMEPLVSSDFKGSSLSGVIDGLTTNVVDGVFIKILSWYDNEWGYSCRVADLANYLRKKIQ